jgi:hypothetical protein
VVGGLGSDQVTVRFNSSKVLLAVAKEAPEVLVPQLRSLLKLLDSDNRILKAAAIRTLGHVSRADSHGRITRRLGKILESISGPDLVVATSAIEGAVLVARAKPQLVDRVVPALLSVGRGKYRTAECRSIVIGKALEGLSRLHSHSNLTRKIRQFASSQRRNPRRTTRERARELVRRLETPS